MALLTDIFNLSRATQRYIMAYSGYEWAGRNFAAVLVININRTLSKITDRGGDYVVLCWVAFMHL